MSAPGIQLSSDLHPHFEPTIRQYLKSVLDSIISGNQHALGRLTKAIPTPLLRSSGPNHAQTTAITQHLQRLGNALDAGDRDGTEAAVAMLRVALTGMSIERGPGQLRTVHHSASDGSGGTVVDASTTAAESNLNVKV